MKRPLTVMACLFCLFLSLLLSAAQDARYTPAKRAKRQNGKLATQTASKAERRNPKPEEATSGKSQPQKEKSKAPSKEEANQPDRTQEPTKNGQPKEEATAARPAKKQAKKEKAQAKKKTSKQKEKGSKPTQNAKANQPKQIALESEDIHFLQLTSPTTLKKVQKGKAIDMYDVIAMYASGMQPEKIIQIIDRTNSTFSLTTNQVIRLQTEGIPFKVINHMIRS